MKMLRIMPIICIICVIFNNLCIYATEFDSRSDTTKIKIYQSVQFQNEKDLIDSYETTNKNEIELLLHYINSFELSGNSGVPNDVKYVYITVTQSDLVSQSYAVYPIVLYSSNDKKASKIKSTEYYRLCEIINGLILNKFNFKFKVCTSSSDWAKMSVEKAIDKGLVPKWNQIDYVNNINRLEVCQLLDNMLTKYEIELPKSADNMFEDTYDIAVKNLSSLNIINGKSETKFAPYDYITREEFAKILSRTYSYLHKDYLKISDLAYLDKDSISAYAVDDVEKVTQLGLMRGNENGEFEPQNNITKEEVIVTILRLSELSV